MDAQLTLCLAIYVSRDASACCHELQSATAVDSFPVDAVGFYRSTDDACSRRESVTHFGNAHRHSKCIDADAATLTALSLHRCDAHALLQCSPSNRAKQAQQTLYRVNPAHSATIL
ncbi:hypothetical protein [Xanthomonas floridensis]|uniref:Secreted protein n=1 Tax=Xanthomonas floridensis TaxID=1843580 RepID=A0ABU5PS28_9XANT|nr:hypothetical protein [Xanthomonas floridensis]MEA5122401.1 hypothetical protein [Xanthomonas floridensis]MEA5131083.1 hypothetical protein [Xanthomonas floridensis]